MVYEMGDPCDSCGMKDSECMKRDAESLGGSCCDKCFETDTHHTSDQNEPTGEVRLTSATGGQKGTKAERYDLIPVEPLRLLAELYGKGAQKYEAHNWMLGYEWGLSYAAAQRHLNQFWGGEDLDEEMQLPHVISVAFHMFALAQFMIDHPEYDNRPKGQSNDRDN